MNTIVLIFLVVCAVLLVFDICFIIAKNMRNHRYYPRMEKFQNQIQEEIDRRKKTDSFSTEFERELDSKLQKTKCFIALQNVLDRNPEAKKWLKPYIFSQLDTYKKKSTYEQAYYAFVVGGLGYEKEPVPKQFAGEFFEFLDSKSLYTFSNTMDAIYEFGEMTLLLSAVEKVDERAGFYHQKLLVDGLLQARVDRKEFCEKLVSNFNQYSDFMKVCLLDYFRFANARVSELCMKLVGNTTKEAEIRYAAMRYFTKYPCDESKKFFIEVLESKDKEWIDEMMAIQGLSSYKDTKVRELMKSRISSPDWYVRVNAADYLKMNGLDRTEIAEIVSFNDRYTNDLLVYEYRNDQEMLTYINELIEKEGAK